MTAPQRTRQSGRDRCGQNSSKSLTKCDSATWGWMAVNKNHQSSYARLVAVIANVTIDSSPDMIAKHRTVSIRTDSPTAQFHPVWVNYPIIFGRIASSDVLRVPTNLRARQSLHLNVPRRGPETGGRRHPDPDPAHFQMVTSRCRSAVIISRGKSGTLPGAAAARFCLRLAAHGPQQNTRRILSLSSDVSRIERASVVWRVAAIGPPCLPCVWLSSRWSSSPLWLTAARRPACSQTYYRAG